MIFIISAFKIGEARKISTNAENNAAAVYIDLEQTTEESKILYEALQKINTDSTIGSSTQQNPFVPDKNDTLTDTLAKNIFLSYAELQKNNSSLNKETIAENVIGNIDTSSIPRAKFTLSDIKIANTQNSITIKTYGNTIGAIIKDNYTYISNKKNSIDLVEIARIHSEIGEKIINTSAPSSLAQLHLTIANNYALLGSSFFIIANEEKNDPLKSLLAIRTAKDAGENLDKTYTEINNYFIKNDILFNNDESGSIWSRIVAK